MLFSKAPSTLNHATLHGWTPLAAAAEGGNESTMSLLLSAGATKGMSALLRAVLSGMGTSVRFLLKNGSDAVGGLPGIAEAMRISVWLGHIDILEMLLNVQGEEKQESWANQCVFGVQDDSLPRGDPFSTLATEITQFFKSRPCIAPSLPFMFFSRLGQAPNHMTFKASLPSTTSDLFCPMTRGTEGWRRSFDEFCKRDRRSALDYGHGPIRWILLSAELRKCLRRLRLRC